MVFSFPPLGSLFLGEEKILTLLTADLKTLLDVGFCGIVVNVTVFVLVSATTKKKY